MRSSWYGKAHGPPSVGFGGSDPMGIRTPVPALKGQCPRPLDDRATLAGTPKDTSFLAVVRERGNGGKRRSSHARIGQGHGQGHGHEWRLNSGEFSYSSRSWTRQSSARRPTEP